MKEVLFGTSSENKLKEIKIILGDYFKIITPNTLGINIEPEEVGKTFKENAIIKAKEYFKELKRPVITEDTGLCIDALNGRPGIYSKRYYTDLGLSEYDGNLMILNEMKDIPKHLRTARYVSCYCYYDGDNLICTEGVCEGKIEFEIKGNNGFAYDSIFYSNDLNECLGLVTDEKKSSISQRSKAIKLLKEKLKEEHLNIF